MRRLYITLYLDLLASLVEEAKGAISFVDKGFGYEIRLFNGEKLGLPPR